MGIRLEERLEERLADLRRELAKEVRTQRLVVATEDGYAGIVAEVDVDGAVEDHVSMSQGDH